MGNLYEKPTQREMKDMFFRDKKREAELLKLKNENKKKED